MKTKLLSIATMLLMSVTAFAQENEKKCELNHAFGFNVGSTTGIGLSYQLWHKQKCALQLTAGPRITNENDQYLNFGLGGIYKLRDRNRVDFLTYGGVNFIHTRGIEYDYSGPYYGNNSYIKTTNQVNVGAGIGFEFNLAGDFYVNAMGGFGAYSTNNRWSLLPAGEISLFYKL